MYICHPSPSNSKQETTNSMSHVTVVAGLLHTLDHYQPQISLKLHIKYCTLDDKIVALHRQACMGPFGPSCMPVCVMQLLRIVMRYAICMHGTRSYLCLSLSCSHRHEALEVNPRRSSCSFGSCRCYCKLTFYSVRIEKITH